MIPHYNNYNHKSRDECMPIERMGGATRHYNGTCEELKKIHKLAENDPEIIERKKLAKYLPQDI